MTEITFNEIKQPFGLMFFEKFTKNEITPSDTSEKPHTALTSTATQTTTHRMGGDVDAGGDIDSW